MKKTVLVTGGAGYIGSHVVKALFERGYFPVVYDDLSSGHREAVLHGDLVVGSLKERQLLEDVFSHYRPLAVMHFAAFIVVPESVKDPLRYYQNNLAHSLGLLETMVSQKVKNFIFSSSAAVYGNPVQTPIPEDHPLAPINPYGASKFMMERIMSDLEAAGKDFCYVSLRYFNAAGADPQARIGEAHNPETHLIPLLLQTALGKREKFYLYGTDYNTPDGTCLRDFIHVEDLALLHVLALEYLLAGGQSTILNCGYGHGYSVKEVIETACRVTKKAIPVEEKPPRPGDPPILVAQAQKVQQVLGFKPQFDDLDHIIETAWQWELNRRY